MNKSESVKEFAAAMANFQGDVKNPAKSATNPYFNRKYTPLDEFINAAKPALAKHGLSFIQSCACDGTAVTVTTLLLHNSGEWVELDPLTLKADKATAQGAGSAITYARRYALSAALGMAGEDDDDGNGADPKPEPAKPEQQRNQQKKPEPQKPKAEPQKPDSDKAFTKPTTEMLKALNTLAQRKGIDLSMYGVGWTGKTSGKYWDMKDYLKAKAELERMEDKHEQGNPNGQAVQKPGNEVHSK